MSLAKRFIKDVSTISMEISKETESVRVLVIGKIFKDFIKYGASPNNYKKFDFCRLSDKQKKTYVTNRVSNRMIKKYNEKAYINIFEDKVQFAKKFAQYFKREWMYVDECSKDEWDECIREWGGQKVICKPIDAAQGRGICVINPQEYSYENIKEKFKGNIIEEFIKQHHEIAEFYDKAVNCLRVITVLKHGKVNILVANLTFGSEYEIANASYGGITVEVDVETGELISPGGQFGHHIFEVHPYSNKKFKGFVIPFWHEIVEMLSECGKEVPQIGYVGWDIAITENGPVIIEGNTTPGYT